MTRGYGPWAGNAWSIVESLTSDYTWRPRPENLNTFLFSSQHTLASLSLIPSLSRVPASLLKALSM